MYTPTERKSSYQKLKERIKILEKEKDILICDPKSKEAYSIKSKHLIYNKTPIYNDIDILKITEKKENHKEVFKYHEQKF